MILASSVMFFAMAASEPWEMVLGYLPMKLQGMPVGVPKDLVRQAAEAAGFEVENRTLLLSTGIHDGNILRKQEYSQH